MNADERAVVTRLLDQVKARGTRSGHLAQQVHQEHRGVCRHDRCSPLCLEWQASIKEGERVLHRTLVPGRKAAS